MDAIFKPLGPIWAWIGHHSYISALVCAVITGLAAFLHSGNMMALFACIGSMIIMYKVEADHPSQGMDLPTVPMA